MTNTQLLIEKLNSDISSTKSTIAEVAENHKQVFSLYKQAKKKMDLHIAVLRDLELQKKLLESAVRKNARTVSINNTLKNIKEFDWNTAIDCSNSNTIPQALRNILFGTIASADSYNVYTEQRQISLHIHNKTTNVELLIAKTIIEQVKKCPIPLNTKDFKPSFTINTSEYKTRAILVNNKWCIQYENNKISEPFKLSLIHI